MISVVTGGRPSPSIDGVRRVEQALIESITDSTSVPAIATGPHGRIKATNEAADALLGLDPETAVGRPCHEVLAARDIFGNLLCHEKCAIRNMAEQQEPICPFLMTIGSPGGSLRQVSCSVLTLPGAQGPILIHLLRPEPSPADVAGAEREGDVRTGAGDRSGVTRGETPAEGVPEDDRGLTPRELETLRFLAQRKSPKEIATAFGVSLATSRNHVQRVLRKLSVHSQAEAVAFALRNGLV